jgi:hydrogenase nickel incorporation protein HypB
MPQVIENPIAISRTRSPALVQLTEYQTNEADVAALNRAALKRASVFAMCLSGGPSSGKTTLLRETLRRIGHELRVGVIVCNVRAEQDTERLRAFCDQVAAVEAVELTASSLHSTLDQLDLTRIDLLFIERGAGAAPCAADVGQSATVGVFSACGGDDKVQRYIDRVDHADLVLVTKADLLPFVAFNPFSFRAAVKRVNPRARVLEVSVTASEIGMHDWCRWLRDRAHGSSETVRLDVNAWSDDSRLMPLTN